MENAELDVALEELESRLERLRALYEQYFMGIERIEPQIPRKDVDRRIYVLRREKIRNTAKRFKLQTIISRYNTFQQYWQRICREIENGTYKRHVIKAEKIAPGQMLTIAARKRLGRHALEQIEDGAAEGAAANGAEAPASVAPPAPAVPSSLPPSVPRPASSLPGVPRPAAAAAGAAPKLGPPPKPAPPPKPGARPSKPEPAPAAPVSTAPKSFESLNLDMDFMGDWDPFAAAEKAQNPAQKRPAAPSKPFGQALARPLPPPSTPPPAPKPEPKVASPAVPAPRLGAAPIAKPAAPGPAPKPAAPPAAAPPKPQPAPVAAKPPPAAPPPTKPAPAAAAAKPAPAQAPVAAKPAPAKPAETPAIDDRVRELHARLVEAKKQTKDATAVSVEGLAKSLKATEAKLREQHKDRKIDFDVVIKDGKAVLKPTVR